MDKLSTYIMTLILTFIVTFMSSFSSSVQTLPVSEEQMVAYNGTAVNGENYYDYKIYQFSSTEEATSAFLTMYNGAKYKGIESNKFKSFENLIGYLAWYDATLITHVVVRDKTKLSVIVIDITSKNTNQTIEERTLEAEQVLEKILPSLTNGEQ